MGPVRDFLRGSRSSIPSAHPIHMLLQPDYDAPHARAHVRRPPPLRRGASRCERVVCEAKKLWRRNRHSRARRTKRDAKTACTRSHDVGRHTVWPGRREARRLHNRIIAANMIKRGVMLRREFTLWPRTSGWRRALRADVMCMPGSDILGGTSSDLKWQVGTDL